MNKFTYETNAQAKNCNETATSKSAQPEAAAVTNSLEPWQLDLVGGGEMIVCW